MKKTILCLSLFCSAFSFAQLNISRDVIATTGSVISNSSLQISFTIGETFTSTLTSTNNTLSMGFQQGDLFVASTAENGKEELTLFPNPADDQITLKTTLNSSFKYNIYDISGRVVMNGNGSGNLLTVNLTNLVQGKYFIEYIPETGENQYLPFITIH